MRDCFKGEGIFDGIVRSMMYTLKGRERRDAPHAISRYVFLRHGFENPHNSLRPSAWGDLIPSDVEML